MFFITLPIAKMMHDTAYLALNYWKSVRNYFGASEGNILNVHPSGEFGTLNILSSPGRRLLRKGTLTPPKMLSNEELSIVLRWQITFDSDQKATAIDQTTGGDGRVDQDRLFCLLWLVATKLRVRLSITYISLVISVVFKNPGYKSQKQ